MTEKFIERIKRMQAIHAELETIRAKIESREVELHLLNIDRARLLDDLYAEKNALYDEIEAAVE